MRVVILRALKLGDFLTAVPAYRAIRRAFPNDRIVLAAPRALAPLAALLGGAIDDVADTRELAPLPPDASDADVGINLHGRGPQSHRLLLQARAGSLIAFRHPDVAESAGGPEHDPDEHEVERWCRLLRAHGIAADPQELDLPAPRIVIPRRLRGATLLHPGASSVARRWPVERWIEVARAEHRLGRRAIITGDASELPAARAIADAASVPPTHVYAGRTNVCELAALVAASSRVVCGDTGIAHLATAYRRPSVVLFGPVAPSRWGPPPRPYHRVLWSGTTGDPHADRVDPGLLAIPAARVIAELDALPA
ncbi:MAG TPA: glycosyltransferase family 9 protein [Candidatus Elarobacter sp.]